MSGADPWLGEWAATERDIRAALAQVEIGPEPTEWVNDFLDHNELGLAFATLVEALDELGSRPPATAVALLGSAYDRMERPADGCASWERIRQRTDT